MKVEFIEVSPKTGLLIGFIMLGAAFLFVGWKFNRIATEIKSLQWPVASGVVESSDFNTSTRRSGNTASTTYHGKFNYRYSVDGREYIGHRYDTKGNMQTGNEIESVEFAAQIKNNSNIDIFYNPNDPSESLLKNGISEDTWVRSVFSLFLLIVGSIVLSYQCKRYRNGKAEQDTSPNY